MFIGRLLALGLSILGIAALADDFQKNASQEDFVLYATAIGILGLIALLVFLSFFKKHYRGTHTANPAQADELRHEHIGGLKPALAVVRFPEDELVRESLEKALRHPSEVILLKVTGRDTWKAGSLLALTNRRILYYRTRSLGLAIALTTLANLIYKIPFGGLILWPFEGLADAWRRLRNAEYRNVMRTARTGDDLVLSGKVPKWKLRHNLPLKDIFPGAAEGYIKRRFWGGGLTLDLTPGKMRDIFKRTEFIDPDANHLPVYECLATLLKPQAEARGLAVEVKPGQQITVRPRPEGK